MGATVSAEFLAITGGISRFRDGGPGSVRPRAWHRARSGRPRLFLGSELGQCGRRQHTTCRSRGSDSLRARAPGRTFPVRPLKEAHDGVGARRRCNPAKEESSAGFGLPAPCGRASATICLGHAAGQQRSHRPDLSLPGPNPAACAMDAALANSRPMLSGSYASLPKLTALPPSARHQVSRQASSGSQPLVLISIARPLAASARSAVRYSASKSVLRYSPWHRSTQSRYPPMSRGGGW